MKIDSVASSLVCLNFVYYKLEEKKVLRKKLSSFVASLARLALLELALSFVK